MVYCAVFGCTSNNNKRSAYISNYRYFCFPSLNKELCDLWVQKCYQKRTLNVKTARICSRHFTEADYCLREKLLKLPKNKWKLKSDAVPNINLAKSPKALTVTQKEREKRLLKRKLLQSILVEQKKRAQSADENVGKVDENEKLPENKCDTIPKLNLKSPRVLTGTQKEQDSTTLQQKLLQSVCVEQKKHAQPADGNVGKVDENEKSPENKCDTVPKVNLTKSSKVLTGTQKEQDRTPLKLKWVQCVCVEQNKHIQSDDGNVGKVDQNEKLPDAKCGAVPNVNLSKSLTLPVTQTEQNRTTQKLKWVQFVCVEQKKHTQSGDGNVHKVNENEKLLENKCDAVPNANLRKSPILLTSTQKEQDRKTLKRKLSQSACVEQKKHARLDDGNIGEAGENETLTAAKLFKTIGGNRHKATQTISLTNQSESNMKLLNQQLKSLQFQNKKLLTQLQKERAGFKAVEKIFTPGQLRKLKTGRDIQWSEDDIASAKALYDVGPRSYFLLKKRGYPLPGVSTLNRWSKKINTKPDCQNFCEDSCEKIAADITKIIVEEEEEVIPENIIEVIIVENSSDPLSTNDSDTEPGPSTNSTIYV